MTPRVALLLLVQAVLWGSAFPLIKVGLGGFSPVHLTLARFLVASLCFVPTLLLLRRRLLPHRRDLHYFFLLGALGITIYHLALNVGQQYVTAGAASLLIATAPVLTAVFAYFFGDDRLPVGGWLGSLVALAGVALIVRGDNPTFGFDPYALLIVLAATVTALYALLQRRMFARYTPLEVTAFSTWAGTLPLFVFLPGFPERMAQAGAAPLLAAVYIGIFPAAVAYALFAYALSRAPATLVTTYLYTVPLFSLLFSWLLLGEVPSYTTLVGGLVTIVGVVTVNGARRRAAARLRAANRPL